MGCGKSKHDDVASGNTILQCKKSNVSNQENGIESKDTNDNVNLEVQVEHKESESVKEFVVQGKDDKVVNDVKDEKYEKTNLKEMKEVEKTNMQEEKEIKVEGEEEKTQETIVEKGQLEGEKDESLKENEKKFNDIHIVDTTKEKMQAENEKGARESN